MPRKHPNPFGQSTRSHSLSRAWVGLISASLLAASAAGQDDSSWTFEVTHFQPFESSQTLIRLKPAPRGREFPRSCEELTLYSAFEPSRWNTKMRQALRRDDHEEALKHLQEAHLTNKLVRLGSFDRGFGAIPEYPRCEVASRGLMRIREKDEHWAIYSFY